MEYIRNAPYWKRLLLLSLLLTLWATGAAATAEYILPPGNIIFINETGIYLFNATDGIIYSGTGLVGSVINTGGALGGPYDTILVLLDNITQSTNVSQITQGGATYDNAPLLSLLLPADEVAKYRYYPLTIVINMSSSVGFDLRGHVIKGIASTIQNKGTIHMLAVNTTLGIFNGAIEQGSYAIVYYPNNTNTLTVNSLSISQVEKGIMIEDELTTPGGAVTGGASILDTNITKASVAVALFDEEPNTNTRSPSYIYINNTMFTDNGIGVSISGEASNFTSVLVTHSSFKGDGTHLFVNTSNQLGVSNIVFSNNTIEGGVLVHLETSNGTSLANWEKVSGLIIANNSISNVRALFNETKPSSQKGMPAAPLQMVFANNTVNGGYSSTTPTLGVLVVSNQSSIVIDNNDFNNPNVQLAIVSAVPVRFPVSTSSPNNMLNFTNNRASNGNFSLSALNVELVVLENNNLSPVNGTYYYDLAYELVFKGPGMSHKPIIDVTSAGILIAKDNTITTAETHKMGTNAFEPQKGFRANAFVAQFRGVNTITITNLVFNKITEALELNVLGSLDIPAGSLKVNNMPVAAYIDTSGVSLSNKAYSYLIFRNVTGITLDNVVVAGRLYLLNVTNASVELAPTSYVHEIAVTGYSTMLGTFTTSNVTLVPVNTSVIAVQGIGSAPTLHGVTISDSTASALSLFNVNAIVGDRIIIRNMTLDKLVAINTVASISNITLNQPSELADSIISIDKANILMQLTVKGNTILNVSNSAFIKTALYPSIQFEYVQTTSGQVNSINATFYNNTFYKTSTSDTNPFVEIVLYDTGSNMLTNLTPVATALQTGASNISFVYNGRGNWWSDATARDSNNDGILDAPYIVYQKSGSGWSIRITDPVPLSNPPVPVPTGSLRSALSYPLRVTLSANVGEQATVRVNVTNTGTAYFDIVDMYFVGAHAQYFTIVANYPIRVVPGSTFTFNVTFTPDAPATIDMDLVVVVEGYFDNPFNKTRRTVTIDVIARGIDPNLTRLIEQVGVYIKVSMSVANVLNEALEGILQLPSEPGQAGGIVVLQEARKVPLDKLVKGLDIEDPNVLSKYDKNKDNKVTAIDLAEVLIENGLLKEPPKLTKEQAEQLLNQLKRIYGENLERLPTFDAKLYIAALVEQSEAE